MRSLGDLPKVVLILEGIGMLLLILAYLSIHDYLTLPLSLASTEVIVGMIFLGVLLMIPAVACLVWRVSQGWGPLLSGPSTGHDTQPDNGKEKAEENETMKKRQKEPKNHENDLNL